MKPIKNDRQRQKYWKTNVIVIVALLSIWGTVSCLFGIVFIESLNAYSIGNVPLGFWIANQGAMLVFIVLILIYAVIMDWLDRSFHAPSTKEPGRGK